MDEVTTETAEIIRNARASYKAYLNGEDGITLDQLHDVYFICGREAAERELK